MLCSSVVPVPVVRSLRYSFAMFSILDRSSTTIRLRLPRVPQPLLVLDLPPLLLRGATFDLYV